MLQLLQGMPILPKGAVSANNSSDLELAQFANWKGFLNRKVRRLVSLGICAFYSYEAWAPEIFRDHPELENESRI